MNVTLSPRHVKTRMRLVDDVESSGSPGKPSSEGIRVAAERIGRKLFWGTALKPRWSLSALRVGRSFLKRRGSRQVVILSSAPPAATHLVALGLAAFEI